MPEILLHYIWQHGLFRAFPQYTTDGKQIEVLSTGRHNRDAGPDFTDVRLRITGRDGQSTLLVGEIEIHVLSSDWYRHRHHTDKAYDHLVLHVVGRADKQVFNTEGEAVEQCELRYPNDPDYMQRLMQDALQMDTAWGIHPCAGMIREMPEIITDGWRQALLNDRLRTKNDSISRLLALTHNNREEAFYVSLAHNFGFHTNGIPFEQLALQTPHGCLMKHRDNLFQLTALLLGQSGLLEEHVTQGDTEYTAMWNEYLFLRHKFNLTPLSASLWKRARLRPANFPEVRIRQFAALLHGSEFLLSKVLETNTPDGLRCLFTDCGIGESSANILLINTVVPFRYAFSNKEESIRLLHALPPEDNSIIRQWRVLKQVIQDAADTQALIHLYQNFCQPHRCVNCDVARQIFLTR